MVSKQVKRRAEAVQVGDGAESRAGGCGRVGVTRQACGSVQESLYFRDEDFREGGDGGRAVGEEAPQSLDPSEGFLYIPGLRSRGITGKIHSTKGSEIDA